MLATVRRFTKTLVDNHLEGITKAALVLCVLLGATLVVVGNAVLDGRLGAAVSTIGVTALGSGVFAGVLKYFQFVHIFKREFEELMKSPSFRAMLLDTHFSMASQGTDVYEHTTARKIAELYPDLQDAFSRCRGDYSDGQFDYYFDNFERFITIRSFNRQTGIVELQDETTVEVVPPGKEPVSYSFFVRPDARILPDGFRMMFLSIDGIDKTSEAQLSDGRVSVQQTLQGKRRYRVSRRVVQRFHLRFDPLKVHHFERLTLNPRVRILNEMPAAIDYEFMHVNSHRAWSVTDLPTNVAGTRERTFTFHDLLFPHQGYYISFAERPDVNEPIGPAALRADRKASPERQRTRDA